MPALRAWPDFSWSHSRDRAFLECARAYYWRYYGSHNGWSAGADPETRLAYALKHLTTLPLVLGAMVHECARDGVLALRRGEARPTFEAMLTQVGTALNRAVLGSHHRDAFLADPRRIPMLREAWIGGRQETGALPRALARARRCLRALVEAPVWSELEACAADEILVVDRPEAFVHEGWAVYAGPDLVYRRGGEVVILDWKTGAETDVELQLALYALYCRKVLGLPFREGHWWGRVVNLSTGGDTTRPITRADLLGAAERIRDSVHAMQALLADAEENAPLPRESFPLLPEGRRQVCAGCSFFPLCRAELEPAQP